MNHDRIASLEGRFGNVDKKKRRRLATAEPLTKAKDSIRRHIHSVWQLELPTSFIQSETIEETARMYDERKTAIISFVYASPMRSFSDAFILKPQED